MANAKSTRAPTRGRSGRAKARIAAKRKIQRPHAFHVWLETERQRLMRAEAVLSFVVLSDADADDFEPSPTSAAEAARDLVTEAIRRLDSAYLGALLDGKAPEMLEVS